MRKYLLLIASIALFQLSVWAQVENNTPTATPNAASLGVFGQIPVDYFTGTPEIGIPLYTYKSRDISVPIQLSYHSGNYRPGDHPSWIGLGWTLQAGGMITRIQNDLPDELIASACPTTYNRGFFYNYNALVQTGWNSTTGVENAAAAYEFETQNPNACQAMQRADYAPDEFQFNFMGMSGSLVMGQDGQWHQKGKQGTNFAVTTEIGPYAVWEPNVITNNNSQNLPSLIHNCLTRFILTAADGTKYFFGTDPATNMHGWTSGPTLQYFSTLDSNAVEFARVGTGYDNAGTRGRDGGTVAMTWLLTKILSPTGDSVVFRYTRDGPQVIYSATAAFGSYTICSSCNPQIGFSYGAGDVVSILDGSTLSSITGANGSVRFVKSRANILDYTILGNIASPQDVGWTSSSSGLYTAYALECFQGDGPSGGTPPASVFMELDDLNVLDNFGSPVKSFAFNYNKSATNRLWLNSVTETGADGSTLPPYSFSYNNISGLNNVPYNTVSIDHWGYYTAVDPFTGLFASTDVEPTYTNPSTGATHAVYGTSSNVLVDSGAFNAVFNAIYTANRNPVNGPQQYGILTQITFPTGGNTQFVWEPNQYSKFLNGTVNPGNSLSFAVQDLGANTAGPGVRIHQIIDQAGYNAPQVTKTFTYFRDFVNNNYTSSGVLNSAQPGYCDEYRGSGFFYRDWSSQDVNATHYTDGSPITYTNVQEQNSDGSFKTFTYSNQDNGYQDWSPSGWDIFGFPSLSPVVQSVNLTSMELERGLLLQENSYGVGSVLLEHRGYLYNNAPGRFQDSINRYTYTKKFSLNGAVLSFDDGGFLSVSTGSALYYGDITTAISIHYYYPWLQGDTVTRYDQNGANPMTAVTNYAYNEVYRSKRSESYTSSKNEPVVKTYLYSPDVISGISGTTQQVQNAMFTAGMTGIPLEETETRSGTQTEQSRMDYQSYLSGGTLLVPGQSYKVSYSAALEPLTQYVNYDNLGNISEYITRNGLSTCYDWGYNQSYPVVKITNASNTLHSYPVTNNSTGGSSYTWPVNNFVGQQLPFNVQAPGNIVINGGFESNPGTETWTFNYSLSGPPGFNTTSGQICIQGPEGSCPLGTSIGSVSVPGGPYGQYTLNIVPQSNFNNLSVYANYTYPIQTTTITTTGSKNYFYDGFEENSNAAVVSGTAHTGDMYWGGSSYTPAFTPPDNNAYTIEWWALQGGSWVYQTQAFSAGMRITGPVDDVRIFPAGSMMSTYTYRPLVGMTSEIDPRGYTSYFTYDAFGRLSADLDKDRNVLKRYCYNYTGEAGSCPVYTPPAQETVDVNNTTNQANVVTFTNQTTNIVLTYSVPAGTQQAVKVPSGTYGMTIAPANPTASYPINFSVNGMLQTYFATVGYTNVAITGASTVTIAPPAEEVVNVTNTSTEAMILSFNYYAGSYSYTYTFNVPANSSGGVGSVPTGSYTVGIGPVSPNAAYPLVYSLNGMPQTYYGQVGYGPPDVSVTGTQTVTIAPVPPLPIVATNSSNAAITIKYTNTATNQVYTFTSNALSVATEIGTVPPGTYGVTMGPTSPSTQFPISYNLDGMPQTYYATVGYAAFAVNSVQNIILAYPPTYGVYVTNTSNKTVTLTFTNAWGSSQVFTAQPGYSNTEVGGVFAGTFNVLMAPSNYSSSYPILWQIYNASQEYYATVVFGGVVVNSNCPINISFY